MGRYERGHFGDRALAGVPFRDFVAALETWRAMQQRDPAVVAIAALAFNTSSDVIEEAVAASDALRLARHEGLHVACATIEIGG